jgi:endogenous inhibitor of DNA gyrase (YacG/DUF329 family)
MAMDRPRAMDRSRGAPLTDRPNAETGSRIVRCPACTGPAIYGSDNPYRPFCGARCKNGDLASWGTEQMRIAEQSLDSLGEQEQ